MGCFLLYKFEYKYHFEKVPIHTQAHFAALKLTEAFCNGKAKAAALSGTGAVPSHKSLHQLFTADVKFVPGNIT